MREALELKFNPDTQQGAILCQMLLNTENKILVEHTKEDNFWGDGGGPGLGKNMLGELLMERRNELKNYSRKAHLVSPSPPPSQPPSHPPPPTTRYNYYQAPTSYGKEYNLKVFNLPATVGTRNSR